MKPLNKEVLHIKSSTVYTELYRAIDCTNGHGDKGMVVYTNGHIIFVREANEYDEKFKEIR